MNESAVKSQIAYEKIRDLILSGAKLPGTHLVLADLEEELGLGRGPIREALLRLDRGGLVRSVPYKGVIVAEPPTLKEVGYIFAVRIHLESILAIEAMHRLTEKDFNTLESILDEMRDLSIMNFVPLDRVFHMRIYQCARMPHLSLLVDKVLESAETYLRVYLPDTRTCAESLEEHLVMLDSLRRKDAETLERALTRNLQRGIETIQQGHVAARRSIGGPLAGMAGK